MPKIINDEQVFPKAGEPEPKGAIRVVERTVKEDDGSIRSQYIWERPSFVVVVPVCGDKILVKREFKYAAFENLLTFAAGGIRKDETPEVAAARELMEEFGKRVDKLTPLVSDLASSPDKSTERHWIFLAEVGEETEPHEAGEIIRISVREARDLLNHPEMRIALQRLALHEVLGYLQV